MIAAKLVNNLGFELDQIIEKMSEVNAVPGRLQKVTDADCPYQVFVDYAHNPDALQKTLGELKKIKDKSGDLYVIFGCGGERDARKRPIMGKIASSIADRIIITDDNPREEDPGTIRREIAEATVEAEEIPGRKCAIIETIAKLRKGDVLLIAGKGHENYQIIGREKFAFSDAEIVKEAVNTNLKYSLKSVIWNALSLEKALKVKVKAGLCAGPIKFNSLDVDKNDIFIALRGERNGHEFVSDAFSRGASCAIVSRDIQNSPSDKLIKVDDTMIALNNLAEYKRRHSKAKFIAVTGSVGKTSTKEVIKTMLLPYGNTHASIKSYNNYLGVPLTLASMPDDTDYAVIEIGMNAAGEISTLINMVYPDIAIITTVSEGHIEFFESIEAIADAKCEIFEGLDIETGIALINRDMSTYERCIQNIKRIGLQNIQTFGKRQDANVRFRSYELLGDNTVKLNFLVLSEECEIVMENLPMHLASNFAIGFSVVKALGIDIRKAAKAIRSYKPLIGRGRFVKVKHDCKSLGIICDYYNSNPESLKASLKYLKQVASYKKVAVLGDMLELGKMTFDMHMGMSKLIVEAGVSKLFLVGSIIGCIKDVFSDHIKVKLYQNVYEMIADNSINFEDGEIILIKGSRSVKLDALAKSLGVDHVL